MEQCIRKCRESEKPLVFINVYKKEANKIKNKNVSIRYKIFQVVKKLNAFNK